MVRSCILFLSGRHGSVSGGSVVLAWAAGMHTRWATEQNNTCAQLKLLTIQ